MKQVNIKVTKEQHKEAKVLAARLGTSLKGLFLLGIEEGRTRLADDVTKAGRIDWIPEHLRKRYKLERG